MTATQRLLSAPEILAGLLQVMIPLRKEDLSLLEYLIMIKK